MSTLHDARAAPAGPVPEIRPLPEELRELASGSLRRIALAVFTKADDLFFDLSQSASGEAERRRAWDALRLLRVHAAGSEAEALERLDAGFEAAALAGDSGVSAGTSGALEATEQMELDLAVQCALKRAESVYRGPLWQCARLLARAMRRHRVRLWHGVLLPQHFGAALAEALATIPLPLEYRLMLIKLLERQLIADLGAFYRGVLQILERDEAREPRAKPAAEKTAESSSAATSRPVSDAEISRVAEANRWFDVFTGSGLLAAETRAALERLRLPVIAALICEPEALVDPAHPLRKRLRDVLELAVAVHLGDVDAALKLERALADWPQPPAAELRRVERSLSAVGQSATSMTMMPGARLNDGFQALAREQRLWLIGLARRRLANEMGLENDDTSLPSPALPLVRGGLMPVLAVRLLAGGRDSPAFGEARTLTERVLKTLRPVRRPSAQERTALERGLRDLLTKGG